MLQAGADNSLSGTCGFLQGQEAIVGSLAKAMLSGVGEPQVPLASQPEEAVQMDGPLPCPAHSPCCPRPDSSVKVWAGDGGVGVQDHSRGAEKCLVSTQTHRPAPGPLAACPSRKPSPTSCPDTAGSWHPLPRR